MPYLFNTPQQRKSMFETIGVSGTDAFFEQIPDALKLNRPLDLPAPLTEIELEEEISTKAAKNSNLSSHTCFMGGGAYDHFIPAVVDEVVSRGEFYTAYTPYQAEASQGSLQAFFEFQTMICQLTGMDVSNASMYEGGTAVSEAAFMAMRQTRRHEKVVILGSVHPEYRHVLETFLSNLQGELVVVETPEGTADLDLVSSAIDDKTACLIVQQPNFFGCLEDVEELCKIAHENGALAVVSVDPMSLGMLKRPAEYGADIVVAEGQSLGIPLQYGGPYLGILACRQEFMRKMPGRLIGQTVDRNGKRCFVLNLQAREQHIRREKATSNICTNQGLLALRATVFMAAMGPNGMREAAELCFHKSHYAAEKMTSIDGIELMFDRPFFKEFAIRFDATKSNVLEKLYDAGFQVGPQIGPGACFEGLENVVGVPGCLISVTEKRTRTQIDNLVTAFQSN